jgi:MFS family permease
MLLPSLGTSIVNVALPSLAAHLSAPFHDVQWVVLSYLIATTSLIVGAGRLGDRVGRRRLLLAGAALFAAASAAGALSPTLPALIAARAVQGAAAAIMMALTIATVSDVVPKARTGSAMGLLGSISAVGTALGPSLGGALAAWFGWQAVFVFSGAAGVVAFVAMRALPADRVHDDTPRGFDVGGTVLLAVALGCYALTMTLGGGAGWSAFAFGGLTFAGLVGFALVEARVASPLVRLDLLTERALGMNLLAAALVSTVVMATLVVGPFYLSTAGGLDAAATGLVMSVGPGMAAVTGVPAGRFVDRFGAYPMSVAGLTGLTVGALLMTLLPGAFGVAGYAGALALVTAGYAFFQAANNTSVMQGVAADRRGLTSALLGLARNLGLITGASAMGAIFAWGAGLVPHEGSQMGLRATFAVAAILGAVALGATFRSRRGG